MLHSHLQNSKHSHLVSVSPVQAGMGHEEAVWSLSWHTSHPGTPQLSLNQLIWHLHLREGNVCWSLGKNKHMQEASLYYLEVDGRQQATHFKNSHNFQINWIANPRPAEAATLQFWYKLFISTSRALELKRQFHLLYACRFCPIQMRQNRRFPWWS